MRTLTSHHVNGCNEAITITALGEPGQGGANHHYRLEFSDPKWGPDPQSMRQVIELCFQDGPIAEVGTNGLTHEALLAVVIDRLEGFQRGPFACLENDGALRLLQGAMSWLKLRTEKRQRRGVEGTHTV